jgi:hypothetical protein
MLSSIRKKLKSSGNLTDNEIIVGNRIINKLSDLNINFDDISKLSNLDEILNIDPSVLYNGL